MSTRKAKAAATAYHVEERPDARGPSMPEIAVMRICSPRWNAITEPKHGKPQKLDRSEFIRPDDRRVEDVAGQDAGKQHNDLGDHQQCRRDLNERHQDGIDPGCPMGRAASKIWLLNASSLPFRYHFFMSPALVLCCSVGQGSIACCSLIVQVYVS